MAIIKPVILESGQLKTAGVGDQVPQTFVEGLDTSLETKVDKVAGKGLSDTNFTQGEKDKLSGVAVEATKNRADSENADKVHTHTSAQVTGLGTAATKDVGIGVGQVLSNSNASLMGAIASAQSSIGAAGFWEITLPYGMSSSQMLSFQIKEYSGYSLSTIDVSGYLYSEVNNWYLPTCTISGAVPPSVRLGRNAAGYAVIVVSTHPYSGVGVYNPVSGFFHPVNLHGTTITRHDTLPNHAYVELTPVLVTTSANLQQATGSSTELPMSQAATTDALNLKANSNSLGTAATANLTTSNADGTAGRVLKVGDGGWMGQGLPLDTPYGYPSSMNDVTHQTKAIRSNAVDNNVTAFASGIHFATAGTWGRLRVGHINRNAWIQGGSSGDGTGWTTELYHTGNTTKNPDGTLKASSPVINLYTDKHDLHNESQFGATPTVTRKSKGVYEITGTLGLRSEGWYLDTPSDRNGNKYFNIEWTQNISPDAVDGVVDEYRDDIVVTIETFERVWNKDTGMFDNGEPIDINDLQDRFVQLRFNEIKVEHEEMMNDSD